MRSVPRTRRYVSPGTLSLCRPLVAYDFRRGAYVLRGVGDRLGPVLREDRRLSRPAQYTGPERRQGRVVHAAPMPATSLRD